MKNIKAGSLRPMVQALVLLALAVSIVLYGLYIEEIVDFRPLGAGDLNPYGGWSAVRGFAADSSYEFEGISRSIALTIALIVMSIVGGRFFCGWLCPLGAVQDIASWLGERLGTGSGRRLPDNHGRLVWLKYLILLSILLLSIFGYGAVLAGISPWRALQSLPGIVSHWDVMKAAFILLAGILLASIFVTRAFCRYLCPLGAAQALFSSFGLLRLEYGKTCSSCRRCTGSCPAGIGPAAGSDAVSPECIRCMGCVEACSREAGGISLRVGGRRVPQGIFVAMMLILFFGIWLGTPQLWGGGREALEVSLGTLKDGSYQGEAPGFAGKITTEIVVTGGKIIGISIIAHHESKGWYEEVFREIPGRIIEKQRLRADVISGATKTSRGLVKSIESAVKKAQ